MSALVGAVVALTREIYTAAENVPLLQDKCQDFAKLAQHIGNLAQELEVSASTADGRKFFEDLREALARALKLLRKGQGVGLKNQLYLFSRGASFAKELEQEFQKIERRLSSLSLLNIRQLGWIEEKVEGVDHLCEDIRSLQYKSSVQLQALAIELNQQRGLLYHLISQADHEGGNQLQLQDSVVRLIAGPSADQTYEQQLRVEWQEMRRDGLYPVVTEIEQDGESETDKKPDGKSESEHLLDDLLIQHLEKVYEMLGVEEKLEAEKKNAEGLRARVEALEKDLAGAKKVAEDEIERLGKEANTAKEEAKRNWEELQEAHEQYERSTASYHISHKLAAFYEARGGTSEGNQTSQDNYPSAFLCTVHKGVMKRAVVLNTGHSCCEDCARQIFMKGNGKCPIEQKDIYNQYTPNENLRLSIAQWEDWVLSWISNQQALLHIPSPPSSQHSVGSESSTSEQLGTSVESQSPPSSAADRDGEKDREVMEHVEKLKKREGGPTQMALGAQGLRNLLQANRGRWKQVYDGGGISPLIEVLKESSGRANAITVLDWIMEEAVKEAYVKQDGDKVAKQACERIAEEARVELSRLLNNPDVEPRVKAKAAAILGHCCADSAIADVLVLHGTDLVKGLVQLSFSKQHSRHWCTEEELVTIRATGCQVLCRLADVDMTSSMRDDVIQALLKLLHRSETRPQALHALSWLAGKEKADNESGWIARAVLASDGLSDIVPLVQLSKREHCLREPVAACLSHLAKTPTVARKLCAPGGNGGTGIDAVVELLQTVASELERAGPERGGRERGLHSEDALRCAHLLVDVIQSSARHDTACPLQLLEGDIDGVQLVFYILWLTQHGSAHTAPGSEAPSPQPPPPSPSTSLGAKALVLVQRVSVGSLGVFAADPQCALRIVNLGGVPLLSGLLLGGDPTVVEEATRALARLWMTCREATAGALRSTDGFVRLLRGLLEEGRSACRTAAAGLLSLMASEGGEALKLEVAQAVPWRALVPRPQDSAEFRRVASGLATSVSLHWDPEGQSQAMSLALALLEDVREQNDLTNGFALAALSNLTSLVRQGDNGALLLDDFDGVAMLSDALLCGAVETSIRASKLLDCLVEVALAGDAIVRWDAADVLKGLVKPLLELATREPGPAVVRAPSRRVLGQSASGLSRSPSLPPEEPPTPQGWATAAVRRLAQHETSGSWIEDSHVEYLAKVVAEQQQKHGAVVACELLLMLSKLPEYQKMVSEKALASLISAACTEIRPVALRVLGVLTEHCPSDVVKDPNVIELFVKVLETPHPDVVAQRVAAAALVKLVDDKGNLRALLGREGQHVGSFVKVLQRQGLDEVVAGSVLNLLRSMFELKGSLPIQNHVKVFLEVLQHASDTEDGHEIKKASLWILSSAFLPKTIGKAIYDMGTTPSLIACLTLKPSTAAKAGKSVQLLGNLAAYALNCFAEEFPQQSSGMAEALGKFLESTRTTGACCLYGTTLAKALASKEVGLHELADNGCLPPLVRLASNDTCSATSDRRCKNGECSAAAKKVLGLMKKDRECKTKVKKAEEALKAPSSKSRSFGS